MSTRSNSNWNVLLTCVCVVAGDCRSGYITKCADVSLSVLMCVLWLVTVGLVTSLSVLMCQ